jgi:hypothetical protein
MNCRRWCFGVTVVVVAVGIGGIPAVAQQSPPVVEVPGVTVPAVTLPLPRGGPEIATPPISTPPISTPPVNTPAIVTPVATVPAISVPSVKVGAVTVPAVKTAPAPTADKPPTGGGQGTTPGASDPPSGGASSGQTERRATPALAVRGAAARRSEGAPPAAPQPDAAAKAPESRAQSPRARGRRATSTADPVAHAPADRETAPAIGVLDDRQARAPVPVADGVERHETDARPLIDALGHALDLAPILMALALGGALCVLSRRTWRAG